MLAVALSMSGLALVGYGTNVLRELELATVDSRFDVRGVEDPPRNLVVVAIDAQSFSDVNRRWPWPRTFHARLIDRLNRSGARVIAYDVQFTEQSENPAEDIALFEAAGRARGKVVFATTEIAPDVPGGHRVLGGEQNLREIAARAGNANFGVEPGGVLRRLPYETDGLRSFAVVVAEIAAHRRVDARKFGERGAWIDYHGPPGTIPEVSFSDVLAGKTKRGFFEDKIVLVGPTAPTLHDLHPTSTTGDDLMSGAEVQANAISTVLRGFPLSQTPAAVNVALILVLGFLAPLASLRFRLLWTIVAAVGAAVALVIATQLAFDAGVITLFVYPFAALALATVGTIGAYYLLEAFERQRIRDMFARFVSENVVQDVLARADQGLRLGGEEMVGTCMFTDLRGFTSFSESLPASQVISILNHYLTEMSEAILEHGGTLVAYMGDGIFAVFGAPIEQPDHAERSVACAREMLAERLPRFNAWMREQGFGDGFRMGIGLNTGTFMSGNVGSDRRLEYAAIGDVTNTAARLEGMTKGTPFMCFISDTTKEELGAGSDGLVYVDEFEVRGRQSKVRIWSLNLDQSPEAAAEASRAIAV